MAGPKKPAKPDATKATVGGHKIEVLTFDDHEELYIDGARTRFLSSDDGYNLWQSAYADPEPTLLDAAKAYTKNMDPVSTKE